ncbi:MAG: histidine phosphatase family protein [Gammaproteobacteria bacterium]|jgi:broad specificity phosphatase PhoE
MIQIFLVRHGEARIPWSEGRDAGLSERGHQQATAVAAQLSPLDTHDIISSPLLRARETALPLSRARAREPQLDDRFCEVPIENDVARRKAWLTEVAVSTWDDVDARVTDWREAAWAALGEFPRSTIIFTHFMLINAMVTRATNDPRLVSFEPDYASVTTLTLDAAGCCTLVTPGRGIA